MYSKNYWPPKLDRLIHRLLTDISSSDTTDVLYLSHDIYVIRVMNVCLWSDSKVLCKLYGVYRGYT